ncbi:hypothetical protein Tco_0807992 [Tanacetum coccineum]
MKIKRLRRQETPRIVGDDSARSEPTEVADSNNFKPLLKEKRLKEQTNVVVEKKAYTWNKEGKEYSRKRFGVEIVSGRHKRTTTTTTRAETKRDLFRKVLRISKETEIKNNTQGEKQHDRNTDGYLEFVVEHGVEHRRSIVEHVFGEEQATTTTRKPTNQFSVLEILPSSISEKKQTKGIEGCCGYARKDSVKRSGRRDPQGKQDDAEIDESQNEEMNKTKFGVRIEGNVKEKRGEEHEDSENKT